MLNDTYSLLQLHQSFVLHQFYTTGPPDIRQSFPRLVLPCVTHPWHEHDDKQTRNLHVELFQPLTFGEMAYRCQPDFFGEASLQIMCVCGTSIVSGREVDTAADPRTSSINSLVVLTGAGLVPADVNDPYVVTCGATKVWDDKFSPRHS